jgi:hypothetical protein
VSTGTTLVTLKQAVRVALATRPGLAGIQIEYAFPTDLGAEAIWMGNAEATSQIPAMRAGTKRVDEEISLSIYVQVLVTDGRGQEEADLRAVELFSEIQQQFAEVPQISPVILWAQITRWSHLTGSYAGNESAHGSRFEITVTARARLGG